MVINEEQYVRRDETIWFEGVFCPLEKNDEHLGHECDASCVILEYALIKILFGDLSGVFGQKEEREGDNS